MSNNISAKIIEQSFNCKTENIITTFLLEFPRIILPEILTHRMFSRNTASSRAIPVSKMLSRIEEKSFIPEYWGKNKKGMTATEHLDTIFSLESDEIWKDARDYAAYCSAKLMGFGVHKQLANRLTEPFQTIQMVLTATDLENFFNLRINSAAQPEIRELAEKMKSSYLDYEEKDLAPGQWHLPFVDTELKKTRTLKECIYISVARCARVSYLLHDGKISDPESDLQLANKLIHDRHLSPTEHQAMAYPQEVTIGNFTGWLQYRKTLAGERGIQESEAIPIISPDSAVKWAKETKLLADLSR